MEEESKEKLRGLEMLKKDILDYAKEIREEAWFYLPYEGVVGFLGTQDVILLGLNPSSGTFPSPEDKMLYRLLKKKGLFNVHITDLIKIRAKNKDVSSLIANDELMKKQVDFFSGEIDIIKPKIIIVMGSHCLALLKKYLPKIDSMCQVIQIKHYSYRFQKSEEKFGEISDKLDDINKIYQNMPKE